MTNLLKRDLHLGWEFAWTAHAVIGKPSDIKTVAYFRANIPGTNFSDLRKIGKVEDNYAADHEQSFMPFAEMDFIYRCTFSAEDILAKKYQQLCFEGLDTVCDIFLNQKKIGSTENAFIGYTFDVAGLLKKTGNELILIFRSPLKEVQKRKKKMGGDLFSCFSLDFNYLRKPAYSFFWDWGPRLPVSGIYRPVYLKGYDFSEIEDFYLRYDLREDRVKGLVEIDHSEGKDVWALLKLGENEFKSIKKKNKIQIQFQLAGIKRWYPQGEGDPYLYPLEISLMKGQEVLDQKTQRLGFRTITVGQGLRQDKKGKRFLFTVNDKEIFCRGYNWIPAENSLPDGYYDQYRKNLDWAKIGNANMIRVWGGGYYEDDEFYKLCDERGILVWQDGAFCCALYPDEQKAFMYSVKQELTYNIKRLRNFTCLAVWCGENESRMMYEADWIDKKKYPRFHGRKIYDQLFPELLREFDPQHFYWPSSPGSPQRGIAPNDPFQGDSHFWDLHTHCEDFTRYLTSAPSFVSETGIQSFPNIHTALRIGRKEDRQIQSFLFDTRNHFGQADKNERLLKFSGALFRVRERFEEAVHLSQLSQAYYLKYAVEHWRSQAYDCGGVLIWQLNDCWPAISWSVVDYQGIPKASFYFLKKAFEPDCVGFKQSTNLFYNPEENKKGELFVASEREGRKSGLVTMNLFGLEGRLLDKKEFKVNLTGRGAVSLGLIEFPEYTLRRFNTVAEFKLQWEDGRSVRNLYTLSRPKHMQLTKPEIQLKQKNSRSISLRTDRFSMGVCLEHADAKSVFDNNYFELLAGEEYPITCSQDVKVEDLKVWSYYHRS